MLFKWRELAAMRFVNTPDAPHNALSCIMLSVRICKSFKPLKRTAYIQKNQNREKESERKRDRERKRGYKFYGNNFARARE